jgi:hypothetical protein
LCPDSYGYTGAVLFNAIAPAATALVRRRAVPTPPPAVAARIERTAIRTGVVGGRSLVGPSLWETFAVANGAVLARCTTGSESWHAMRLVSAVAVKARSSIP